MSYNTIEIHDRGFDCIWQVRFKLSRVAEAQFNTKMTEIPPLLDVCLCHALKKYVLIFLNTVYYIIMQNLSAE